MMNLIEYIKGKRYGKPANKLEREAMGDPFLQDAIDGFDQVEGEHANIIEQLNERLQKRVQKDSRKSDKKKIILIILLSIIISVITLLFVFYFNRDRNHHAIPAIPAVTKPISIDTAHSGLQNPILSPDDIIETEIIDSVDVGIAPIIDLPEDDQNNDDENTFGEAEFKQYFKEHHHSKICPEQKKPITVTFYLADDGLPANVEVLGTDCMSLQKEVSRLLAQAPKWNYTHKQVTMVIEMP